MTPVLRVMVVWDYWECQVSRCTHDEQLLKPLIPNLEWAAATQTGSIDRDSSLFLRRPTLDEHVAANCQGRSATARPVYSDDPVADL